MRTRRITAAIAAGWGLSLGLAVVAARSGSPWPLTALYVAAAGWLGVLPLLVHRWWARYSRCLSDHNGFNRANVERLGEEVRRLKATQRHDCRDHLDNIGCPVAPWECLVCGLRYWRSGLEADGTTHRYHAAELADLFPDRSHGESVDIDPAGDAEAAVTEMETAEPARPSRGILMTHHPHPGVAGADRRTAPGGEI